jgi:hypothetical protein
VAAVLVNEWQIAIGIVQPDLTQRAALLREVLVMLLTYARTVMSVTTVTMVSTSAIRPTVDPRGELWSQRLDFVDLEGGSSCMLNLEDNAVKIALVS